ncbi:FadR/GntR family transcriptional regulator [Algicella marina]|uniref:FadR/GntR family transcriptional regulator n=1 Tax=Algicella marina TaxID=2683284 RepID=UPI0024DF7F4A|nr:FadR/GntR family transcriptional regulator [Algicella marina]
MRNSHAQVVDTLGREIVAGTIAEGDILPRDEDLAARFGVSRTVLREAMKTLGAKGMVVARARIGTKVTSRSRWNHFDSDVLGWFLDSGVNRQFLHDLFQIRQTIEPFAASLAAEKAGREAVAAMRDHVREMAEAVDDKAFALADLAFHRKILEESGNPFLFSVGGLIEAALLTTFRLSSPAEKDETQATVAAAHGLVVDAIEAGDTEAASVAIREVIGFGMDRLLDQLD